MKLSRAVFVAVLFAVAWCSVAFSELPLDLIAVFHSDSVGAALWKNAHSPGDLDGDGFSEVFAKEVSGELRTLVFSGEQNPDTLPVMTIARTWKCTWLDDINNDAVRDLAIWKPVDGSLETLELWFGSDNFLSKTEADLTFHHVRGAVEGFGMTVYAGDIDGDSQNDLIVSTINGVHPLEGRFYIYYGGSKLDTAYDAIINIYDRGEGYNDFFIGSAVGDIDGDGLVDFAYCGNKSYDTNYVAVIFGSIPLDTLPDVMIWSPWGDYGNFGHTIEPLGDINKDGYDDFAVGGTNNWPCIFLGGDPFDPTPIILGDTTNKDFRGNNIANIGDINHDGWDDIAVANIAWAYEEGIVHIYFGNLTIDTEADLVLRGTETEPSSGMQFGYSVGPAGDFNGDGVDDVVISSREKYLQSGDRGNVYVYAGDSSFSTPASEIQEAELPERHSILKQNYPNPFNSDTQIEYTLWGHAKREVEIAVYNILGQRIALLRNCTETGGNQSVTWDGTDDLGSSVPSGIYFYVLKSDDQTQTRKMLFLK